MTDRITAPFTEPQVAALNAAQRSGAMEPLTCEMPHRLRQTLYAEPDGLHCPDDTCTYQQPWAHSFMAQPQPRTERLGGYTYVPNPALAELARVRQQLRDTEDQLAEARQRLEALRIHTAICRIEATIPAPVCGEILNGHTITDVPTGGKL